MRRKQFVLNVSPRLEFSLMSGDCRVQGFLCLLQSLESELSLTIISNSERLSGQCQRAVSFFDLHPKW